jgi:hypothetical protein
MIWVDALCIDQENLKERNFQVQQMGSIYRNAAFVFAWLGEEADDCHLTFEKLKEWGENLLDQIRASPRVLKQLGHAHSAPDVNSDITRDMKDLFHENIWTALVKLVRRP